MTNPNPQLNTQHMKALLQANVVRSARAADKERIHRQELDPAEILRTVPTHWKSARLAELLLTMPRVGRHRAQKWAGLERLSLDKRLGEMTERQRTVMARQVDVFAKRRDAARRILEQRAL